MKLDSSAPRRNEFVEPFLLTPDKVSDDRVTRLADPDLHRSLESRFTVHSRASIEASTAKAFAGANDVFFGLRERRRCRGIAGSALMALAAMARHVLGLRDLAASCYAANESSRRALEQAGFAIGAVRLSDLRPGGASHDVLQMGALLE